jgi:hypothetical protein
MKQRERARFACAPAHSPWRRLCRAISVASGDLQLNLITAGLTMTIEHDSWVPDPGLIPVAGDAHAMTSESAYRKLELGYRASEQYAAMQRRYLQLRFWIARCHPTDLVGDAPDNTTPSQWAADLHWERSHGEN